MEKVNIRNAGLTTLTPNLCVVDCENEKIVFAHGVNIGYITPDGIFYVKKDFYEGGSKHTVFTKQYLEVIEKTYSLSGSITEERVHAIENSVRELTSIRAAVTKEKDPVKLKALLENAASIIKQFGNEANKKRYADIEIAVGEALNPPAAPGEKKAFQMGPDQGAANKALAEAKKNALLQFDALNTQIKATKAKKAAKALMAEAEKLMQSYSVNIEKKDKDVTKAFNAVKRTFSKK